MAESESVLCGTCLLQTAMRPFSSDRCRKRTTRMSPGRSDQWHATSGRGVGHWQFTGCLPPRRNGPSTGWWNEFLRFDPVVPKHRRKRTLSLSAVQVNHRFTGTDWLSAGADDDLWESVSPAPSPRAHLAPTSLPAQAPESPLQLGEPSSADAWAAFLTSESRS